MGRFLGWCGARGLGLRAIAPLHVAAYIRTHPGSVPTVKQHLAAIRALCDWLVVHQVLPVNPAAAVRGPKHVVTKGATPVLTPAEARALLDRIDTGTRVGLRDRALLSVMVYSFARVSAAVGMRRQDYFRQGMRGWLRLHEKGGKRHDVPAHHRAEEAVEAYLAAGGVDDVKAPLFQSVDRAGGLSGRPLGRRGGAGDDQAPGVGGGAAGVDLLPHVSGDGHHGVSVERRGRSSTRNGSPAMRRRRRRSCTTGRRTRSEAVRRYPASTRAVRSPAGAGWPASFARKHAEAKPPSPRPTRRGRRRAARRGRRPGSRRGARGRRARRRAAAARRRRRGGCSR